MGPLVKNPSCKAGDTGSIPGQGTKIPHAVGVTKPTRHRVCALQGKISRAATKTRCSQINKYFFKKEHLADRFIYLFCTEPTAPGNKTEESRVGKGEALETSAGAGPERLAGASPERQNRRGSNGAGR